MKRFLVTIMAGCMLSSGLFSSERHADAAHIDTAQADTAYVDTAQADVANADAAHADTAYVDIVRADAVHPGIAADTARPGTHGTHARQKMRYRGFIGGMMLHTGYVRSHDLTVTPVSGPAQTLSVSGAPFGVGGAIRFLFGKHLRVGAEGYVSTLTYGKYKSHAETGWGGILADCAWDLGRCNIFAGGTLGGGSQTNTTILTPVGDDYYAEEGISYRKYGFCAFAPFVGVEYALTGKVNIVVKADWMLNVSNPQDDFVSGPRLYVGFMFGHTDSPETGSGR